MFQYILITLPLSKSSPIHPYRFRYLSTQLSTPFLSLLALGGSTDHSDQDGSGSGMDPEYQQSQRLWPHPQAFDPLVVTQPSDFNTEPGFGWTMDPDMVLGSILGIDVMMAAGGGKDDPIQHGPNSSLTLGHQRCLRWQPRPQESA